jgi:hypothetical protein
MSQTTTRDERKSALDEFAQSARQETEAMLLPAIAHAAPPSLMHGAQQVPVKRDDAGILRKLSQLAAAAGDDWFYRIPFKDKKTGRTTFVEGPSIKLANDLARIYGNCDVDSWVSGEGADWWEITARFIDLESGFSMTRPFRQRKSAARIGGDDGGRRDEMSFGIGVSKAERNVVVNALQTYGDFAFEEARNALVDKVGRDVDGWRAKILERLQGMVALPRVEAAIGRPARDWLAPDIARVAAMGKAIRDGMATVDETFPPLKTGGDPLDDFATAGKMVKEAAGGVSTTPVPSSPDDAAGAPLPPQPPAPADALAFEKSVAIEAMLDLAHAADDEDERLADLNRQWPIYQKKFEKAAPQFLGDLFATAERVARGEMRVDEARKHLEKG